MCIRPCKRMLLSMAAEKEARRTSSAGRENFSRTQTACSEATRCALEARLFLRLLEDNLSCWEADWISSWLGLVSLSGSST